MPSKKIVFIINAFLICVVIFLAFNIVRIFKKEIGKIAQADKIISALQSGISSPKTKESVKDYNFYANSILRRELLGGVSAHDAGVKAFSSGNIDKISFPKTALNLILKGTVVYGPDRSFAVIQDSVSGQQKLYKIGENVSGAKIEEIYRRKIVLERNSQKEVLLLLEDESGGARSVNPAPVSYTSASKGQKEEGPAVNKPEIDRLINQARDFLNSQKNIRNNR